MLPVLYLRFALKGKRDMQQKKHKVRIGLEYFDRMDQTGFMYCIKWYGVCYEEFTAAVSEN